MNYVPDIDLATATEQEVFDFVITKVVQQGKACMQHDFCTMTCDGLRCAVGFVTPDSLLETLGNQLEIDPDELVTRLTPRTSVQVLLRILRKGHDQTGLSKDFPADFLRNVRRGLDRDYTPGALNLNLNLNKWMELLNAAL